MSSIRERLLGTTSNNSTSSIRDRLELNSSYYKKEYENEISKRNEIQKNIQKSTYENGVQTTVTPFSTQRNTLPVQEQTETTKNKKFQVTAGQDILKKNKEIENKYQEIKQSDTYKKQMQELENQSNKVGYAKYNYDKQRVAEDDIGWYDKSIGRLVDGFGNLIDYNGGLIKNENGDVMYLPTFNQMKNEKVQNEYDTAFGRFAGNVLYESGRIAGSTLVNQVLPGAGSTMYFGKMFVDSTNQALSDGYDSSSATIYGLINVGLEYATGKLLGSATKGLTGGKASDYENLLNKAFSKIIKKPKIASILANAGSEATEEFVQEYLDNITKLAVLEKSTDIKDYFSIFADEEILTDALYSAAVGGATGGIFGTFTSDDTNVDNDNLYKTFKEELEETKKNTTNADTINKIDTIISNIDNQINNTNTNTNTNTIISQIEEYQALKEQNKLTKNQEVELKKLQEQLANIQNQNTNVEVTDIVDTTNVNNNDTQKSVPLVQDIIEMENRQKLNNNILPVSIQNSNVNNTQILPTKSTFENPNINMSANGETSNLTKIKPKILEDIKGFKLGNPNVESYKGSYIKKMMNEVGIKVPTAMNYVNEVKPDMSYTTTMKLNEEQNASIKKALQELKNIDVNSINNINYSIPIGNYKYVKSSNSNINELRRTASMYLNNTARTNNTIKLLENIIKDRNYTIRFNPNITNEQGVSVDGKISVENGQTVIELNPNSSNYIEFLVIHEITHDIATKEMKELILDYAKRDPEFEKSLETLKERYKTDDVSDEVVADVCGELFGNREFIQSVVEKKPNIFKKILNNIRKLAEKIKGTGANEYVSFVENLKEKWEEAYYSNQHNLKETKYMITGLKGAKNAVNNDTSNQFLINNYIKAKENAKNGVINETNRQKTGWFQDNNGDWKFEISDEDANIKAKLEKNKSYKLGDILEHNDLYEMYPNLKNNKVKFTDFDIRIDENGKRYIKKGRINNITNTISLNNELISKGNNAVLNTLVHEIQHRIQKIEKFTQGTTSAIGFENYQKNFGEKEARDTTDRRKMGYETRFEIPPVSSLTDNKIDKSKNKWYSLNEVEQDAQENNTISSQDVSKNIYSRGKLGRNIRGQELDNGSFSLNKSQISTKEWNNYLKENFLSSGTKTKMSEMLLPTKEYFDSKSNHKTLNPNEISQLKLEDANTTPVLSKTSNKNKVQDGESHFAKNIKDKTNMLTAEQKAEILSKEEVRYYDKVTNKESLEKAFERLNNGGSAETLRWFKQDSKNVNATDVAEGWILMKQYSDNGDYDSMVEVAKKMREIGTTAGQTVQAFNILSRMTPEGMVKYAQSELSEAYDRMIKNKSKEWIDKHREDFDLKPDEVKFIMDTMNEVQNMEDGYDKKVKLAEIQKLMTDKLPPQKGAGIKSWMRISMLFNPKTQVRNIAGNALIMPVNSFGDLFSSYADKLISKKTGVRTTGNTNIKAMLKGIKKGAYEATNDYKKGINTKDMDGNRFEISDGKSFDDKRLMGKALNRTESLLNYVMDVGDRVFSEAAFENSLQNQMVLNNTTEITQEMIDIAHQEALSRTWNDNNNYTRFVLGIRKGLNKINVRGYGLGDVLIPFAKTPANLTKAIVDYSPAGVVSTITKGINLKRALSNGQYTASMQHDFVQSLGKATAGTMLYVLGIALAKAGITSGDSDDDKDTANFLKNALGISSYSIKIGDKSFTYDWAQPIAAPLSITANVVNSKENGSQALLEAIIGSLDTAGSILLEQSFLQSINDVLSDNDGVASGIINEVLELPARAVPTFSKQIADLVDGTQRTSFEYGKPIKSAVNSIVAKIPFASKTLAPSVDTMGREIQKYGGKNNIFNVFLNPANVNTDNISKSAEEIYRLYKETGETSVMPRVAPYYVNQKGEKITMTNEQRVNYQKTSGKIIEESIEKLLKNSSYSEMSDKEKSEVITDIVNYSYNIAKNEVLGIELSDTYQKAYDYSKIGDIGDYYTFKESIDDTNKDTKRSSITNFLLDSDLNDEQLAFLYGSYYSSEEVLNNLIKANIPIKEFIKFNSQTFESDYYDNGKTVSNSRKKKVINYINSLNLSVAQKAILIKMEYSSYNSYNSQIVNYINKMDYSKYEKACILKQIGFDDYDSYIIETVKKKNISTDEKEEILENLGFKIRNGKVYSK